VPRTQGLTPKQERFIEEYLIDLNATQAALRAGYSAKTAGAIGKENLQKPPIREEIRRRRKQQARETRITANRVLKELACIAFSDLRDFASWGSAGFVLKDSTRLPFGKSRCVALVAQSRTANGGESIRFKLHDKVKALKLLGEHLGLWGKVDEQERFLNSLPERLRVVFRQLLLGQEAADATLPLSEPEPSEAGSAAAGVAPDEASP
jgi:phage terminase small subunit